MTTAADRLVDRYLDRLRSELRGVAPARRDELLEEISTHIAHARAELPSESEVEIRSLLDRVGDPAAIASEAMERTASRPRRRWVEVAALILLLVGGVVVPVAGWFAGVFLLWVSDAWRTRDKVIGTLVVPGGLLPAVWLSLGVGFGYGESCVTTFDSRTGATTETCTGGPSTGAQMLGIVAFVLAVVGPLATTAYLAWRMKRETALEESRPAV